MNRINWIAAGLSLSLLTACMPETEHRPLNPLVVDTFTVAQATESQFRTFNDQVIAVLNDTKVRQKLADAQA
ncbi:MULTISPECIES: hypothetical protein [unclassified Vibrio]|uniref:hypothetical protein n=1 Tax=unclassified Vibrio TaxID=2614977 RepID=UPI002F40E702